MNRKKPLTALQETSFHHYRVISWGLIFVVILLVSAIRIRLIAIPLERDEGEFAYIGQLILQGIPPYSWAANMKLPGTYVAYALIMALFGETIEGIHLGFLLVNISTMLLVFFITRRLFDDYSGVVACATYGILSLSPSVLGTAAHATHFVLFFALSGIAALLKAVDQDKPTGFFLSGILLGLAFIMKQPGIFFGIFGLLYLLCYQRKNTITLSKLFFRRTFLFIAGVITPYTVTCITLYGLGVFGKFWFWTVLYAYQYGTLKSFSGSIRFLAKLLKAIDSFYLLWGLAGIGLLAVMLDRDLRNRAAFTFGFLLFSFLAVCPGFYFREHYFVLILPAVALCAGIAVRYLTKLFAHRPALRLIPGFLFLLFFFHGLFLQRLFFFTLSPAMACRQMYFPNPFPETIEIAQYIKNHSPPDSTIAVLGSEPQIYFYAHRHAATSYLYTYSLMENQKHALTMQKEMIAEIEGKKPEYLIWVNIPYSWFIRTNSEMLLLHWYANYQEHYYLVGIIDIVSPLETKYLWDHEVQGYVPSLNYIAVLKRNR